MDCLVKLYNLSSDNIKLGANILIRRVMAYEKTAVLKWIDNHFSTAWSDECSIAFSQHPIKCLIAIENSKIIGFACYDCTHKNFFGPMGVDKTFRNQGVGKALLLAALNSMKNAGYAYAVIGGCDGHEPFYEKTVNAIKIKDSSPGIYPAKISS
jgi:GNAT superfamily N-acetyltransferase